MNQNAPIRFDRTVTLGNLLTVVTLIAGMLVAWFKMEGRVAAAEHNAERLQVLVERQGDSIIRLDRNATRLTALVDIYLGDGTFPRERRRPAGQQ